MTDPKKIIQGFETRKRIYLFIRDYWATYKIPPSMREIVEGAGISSTSIVSYHLDILRDEGLVDFRPRQNRTIWLVGLTVNMPEYSQEYA